METMAQETPAQDAPAKDSQAPETSAPETPAPDTPAHRARYAAAMAAITARLPFGLSRVIEPNMLGYLLINLCTFFIDLAILGLLHGKERWPIPAAVTCSYGTASLLSYALNRVLNFRSHADVGRQLPVFVAVSASNYLIFVLGLTDLLSSVGVYYELSRVLAACCEAVYLYCMMRWVVFRDVTEPGGQEDGSAEAAVHGPAGQSGAAPADQPAPTAGPEAP
jgi:putative flippase GtrA